MAVDRTMQKRERKEGLFSPLSKKAITTFSDGAICDAVFAYDKSAIKHVITVIARSISTQIALQRAGVFLFELVDNDEDIKRDYFNSFVHRGATKSAVKSTARQYANLRQHQIYTIVCFFLSLFIHFPTEGIG